MSGMCGSIVGTALEHERCRNLGRYMDMHGKLGLCVHHQKMFLRDKLHYNERIHLWVPDVPSSSSAASSSSSSDDEGRRRAGG